VSEGRRRPQPCPAARREPALVLSGVGTTLSGKRWSTSDSRASMRRVCAASASSLPWKKGLGARLVHVRELAQHRLVVEGGRVDAAGRRGGHARPVPRGSGS